MSDPDVIGDRERYAEVGRAYRQIDEAYRLATEYRTLKDDVEGARELLAEDGDDPELKALVADGPGRIEELAEEIRLAMVERDPNDDKNVIVEVRAGAGGDEAALFAGDLYKMLSRYAERLGYSVEQLSASPADVGGYKEATFAIKGDGAYSVFKYEGGTHRVQRVPKTESQGRIHTSTATVAVLPEAEEVEVDIDPNDLRDRRSTAPRGLAASPSTPPTPRCGSRTSPRASSSRCRTRSRSSRTGRRRCACCARGCCEHQLAEQQAEVAAERRAQVGSGERSEKIRTYNFPQDRITDHRVKVTANNIERVLGGELDEFTEALSAEEKRRRLEVQATEAG